MCLQIINLSIFILVVFSLLDKSNILAFDPDALSHQRIPRSDQQVNNDGISGVIAITTETNLLDEKINLTYGVNNKGEINKKKLDLIPMKIKNDTGSKIKKLKDTDVVKDYDNVKSITTESSNVILPTLSNNESNETFNNTGFSPFLLHGEPISNLTIMPGSEFNSSRARALNISAPETTNSLYANITDLSDVSMDEEDKEIEGGEYVANHTDILTTVMPITFENEPKCKEGNETYKIGEKINRGCDEKCECIKLGVFKCEPMCSTPYFRSGLNKDAYCYEQKVGDGCCAILVCEDSAPEPEETCVFGNKTVAKGERIEDGCARICVCQDNGSLKCHPRCPEEKSSQMSHHDRCVALADPRDSCCTITYCDVTLGEHEIKAENVTDLPVKLKDVNILNSTAVKLKLSGELTNNTWIEISPNNKIWTQLNLDKSLVIGNLEPAHVYYIRIVDDDRTGRSFRFILPAEVIKTNITEKTNKNMCNYRGKQYKIGAEWYDECISFCSCNEGGKTECLTIECPTDSGLDVLDPNCIDWETVPPNFVAKAPNCCPQNVRCRNNGSCFYENVYYDNWSEIPQNVTGCEKHCFCEVGKLNCQANCPPVPALPPSTLQCPSNQAILAHLPGDDCCTHWTCDHSSSGIQDHGFPGSFQIHPGGVAGFPGQYPVENTDEIAIKALDALDDRTVRLIFTVPRLLVGLHGRVELRYTSDKENMDPSTWKSQTFIPPNDLIATSQLEFELDGLEPSTEYKVKVTVNLKDFPTNSSSKIYSVRTLDKYEEQTTLPPQIPIDAELRIIETNSTWIKVGWKKFTEYEMQFIDGVQLRYKEKDGKVYAATPLIHRAVTSYLIENIKPATSYEIGISIIPFPGQTTELISEKTVQIHTSTLPDPYKFNVEVKVETVKPQSVEISWTGVPYPADKYVNIYRAIYQSDSGKGDMSTFKIAKRDSSPKAMINDLKPGTRYRLWLEVFLTNGKIKKSNVQDFITKPGAAMSAGITQQGTLASVPLHEGDYYGPLVIVAIVASLSILSTLILLMILMKRRSSSKADISPRKSTSAYDNPSYKTCEDSVVITNNRNKTTEHEMSVINSKNDVKENV